MKDLETNSLEENLELLDYSNSLQALSSFLKIEEDLLLKALKEVFGAPSEDLKEESKFRNGYQSFYLAKRNGGYRLINNPSENLKLTQRNVKNALYKFELSRASKGSVKGVRLKENLLPHQYSEIFLQLDIENAFSSTSSQLIKSTLEKLFAQKFEKWDKKKKEPYYNLNQREREVFIQLLLFLVVKDDFLPQGSPSSPQLFNLIFKDLDENIEKILEEKNLYKAKYTRYLDDISISGLYFEDIREVYQKIEDFRERLLASFEGFSEQENQSTFALKIQQIQRDFSQEVQEILGLENINLETYQQLSNFWNLFQNPTKVRTLNFNFELDQFTKISKELEKMAESKKIMEIEEEIKYLLKEAGFTINSQKTKFERVDSPGQKVTITGIENEWGKPLQVPQNRLESYLERINMIDQLLRYLESGQTSKALNFFYRDEGVFFRRINNENCILALEFGEDRDFYEEIRKEINSLQSSINFSRSIMNHVYRPINKALKILQNDFPQIWVNQEIQKDSQEEIIFEMNQDNSGFSLSNLEERIY